MAERGDGATVITTDRLVVRAWRLDEADRFFDIYRRPEVVRWIGAEPMRDRDEAVSMIERNLTRFDAGSQFGSWAVIDRSSEAVTHLDNNRSVAVCRRIGMSLLGITRR